MSEEKRYDFGNGNYFSITKVLAEGVVDANEVTALKAGIKTSMVVGYPSHKNRDRAFDEMDRNLAIMLFNDATPKGITVYIDQEISNKISNKMAENSNKGRNIKYDENL